MSADSYADLLERLFADYEGRHSVATIKDITAQCRAELAGQHPSWRGTSAACTIGAASVSTTCLKRP